MTSKIEELESASDANRLKMLESQLQEAETALHHAENSLNVEEIRTEVESLKRKKSQQEAEFREREEEILNMQRHAQARTTIDLLKKDKATKEDLVKRIKRRNVDPLKTVGLLKSGKPVEEMQFPSRQVLARWISGKEDEVKGLQMELNKKRQEMAKLSTRHDILTKDLGKKNDRCKQIDEGIFELCGSENFEDESRQVEADIKDLQGSKGLTDGIQFMYKEFLKKLMAEDHENTPCPLCHRLFNEKEEVEELAQELERKLELAPRKMQTQERDLSEKQTRYKLLLQQKPAKEELDRLQAEEIPSVKKQISEMKAKITRVKQSIGETEEALKKVQEDESMAKSCSNDISQIDTTLVEIKELNRKIEFQEAQIPASSGSEKSFEVLQEEKQNLMKAIEKLNKAIEGKRERMESQTRTLLELRQNVNAVQVITVQYYPDRAGSLC